MQISIKIAPEDDIIYGILSRVKGADQRKDFIKEAIYNWDYILHHTNETSCHIKLKTEEILFPPLQLDNTKVKQFNNYVSLGGKKKEPISTRFTIPADDEVLQEIMSRVRVKNDFIKEAIYKWYYAIHNSHLTSRYVDLMSGYEKDNYFIINVENIMSKNQLVELYEHQPNDQIYILANTIIDSLGRNGDTNYKTSLQSRFEESTDENIQQENQDTVQRETAVSVDDTEVITEANETGNNNNQENETHVDSTISNRQNEYTENEDEEEEYEENEDEEEEGEAPSLWTPGRAPF